MKLNLFSSAVTSMVICFQLKRPNSQWYQHLLRLFAIFYESITEETNFRIMFVCFMFM